MASVNIHQHLFEKTDRIVFFDIDSTLTSSIEHHTLTYQNAYHDFKKSLFNENWKTISFADFIELSQSSIALFANMLAQTGAKAVCISSWNTNRYDGIFLKEFQEAFESVSDNFPEDWFLGYAGGSGGDRHKYTIAPFLKETNFKGDYIALDDGAKHYSDQKRAVEVDGKLGFNFYDYEKALQLFGIDEEVKLEED